MPLTDATEEQAANLNPPGKPTWKFVAWSVAILLLFAAGAKLHLLTAAPISSNRILDSWTAQTLVIILEIALALWIVSGQRATHARLASVCTFTMFTAVTIYRIWTGQKSCGCFGMLQISPSIVFCIDCSVLLALKLAKPIPSIAKPALGWLLTFLVASSTVLFVAAKYHPSQLADVGDVPAKQQLVVLRPEEWIGSEFPLWTHLDVDTKALKSGHWILLFHHHICPVCTKAIPRYELLQATNPKLNIAFIEVPPFDEHPGEQPGELCLSAKLLENQRWFIATPVEVEIQNGNVVAATRQLERLGE